MQYYEFIAARSDTGAALPYAKVTVWIAGTTTLAALYDQSGAPLGANPITATLAGEAGFAAANGAYDIQIGSADGGYLSPVIHDVQLYDLSDLDAAIGSLKQLKVSTSRNQIKYDGTGMATPSSQTAILTAVKANTAAIVSWTLSDLSGNPVTPASAYLSSDTGDSVTLTRANFDSARGTTTGLIVTATLMDGVTLIDSTTIVVNRDGTAGTDGTTGNNYFGYGIPANNQYANGDTYTDLNTGLVYGQKTGGRWPLGTTTDVNAATPNRKRIDLRSAGASLPTNHATVTRNSTSTDMLPSDPYSYTPTIFGANVPVVRVGKGLMGFPRAQQLLVNPGTPGIETVAVPLNARVIIAAWGPAGSKLNVAPASVGGATITNAGDVAGDSGVVRVVTVTTAGNITLTPSGGLVKANVYYNPSAPNISDVVPYIASQMTREADQIPVNGELLAALQSPQGYLLMGVSDFLSTNPGVGPTILGLNGVSSLFAASDTSLTCYDVGNHATGGSIGNSKFSTGATVGRTWDTSATVTFGAGDHFEYSHPYPNNNGVGVASACLLGKAGSGNTSGQVIFCGCLGWYEFDTTARLTDEELWNAYTTLPAPGLNTLLKNYVGATQFTKFISSIHQLRADIIDHVKIGIIGPSHEGGVGLAGDTNIRANSWSAQMVADLEALDGYSVAEAFCGTASAGFAGGTSKYDNRLTYTGTPPTLLGVDFGRFVFNLPAGTILTFNPGRSNSRFVLYAYTDATGRGAVEVSNDGGITPILANETGLSSNSTTSASFTGSIANGVLTTSGTIGTIRIGDRLAQTAGVVPGTTIVSQLSGTAGGDGTYSVSNALNTTSRAMWTKALFAWTYDTTLGSNQWSIKAVGNPVHFCLGYAYNPAAKSFVFFNGGSDGYNVTNLARDDDVETSYAYPARVLGCSLWFGCGDDTNDMAAGGTAWATYSPYAASIITNAQLSGSVVMFTDPESSTASYSRALSDKITSQGRAVGFNANVPIYDLYAYVNSDPTKCQWDILNQIGGYNDVTHLSKRANKRYKSNQMRELFNRIMQLV